MNNRIRELIDQSMEPTGVEGIGGSYQELNPVKFAELLIQECANRVSGMVVMDKGYIPQDPHSQGWNDAVAYAGKELKKYFGVEP